MEFELRSSEIADAKDLSSIVVNRVYLIEREWKLILGLLVFEVDEDFWDIEKLTEKIPKGGGRRK